ncbi:hypothetical protein KSP39_PZI023624 [Platanthera zijinensis]|uniref:NmrA-like domain-containing protein n=1 Tax=Platanthera zijinensis TaxID=2320716 RepID=A0AAP0ATC5_9ASPA
MAAEKSRILIIGGTGYIGKFIVKASARAGHPTFALIRESTAADPAKAKILEEFKASGVTLIHGDLYEHEGLVKIIKEVDVVISTVGQGQLADQTKIIAAIKEAGNIKLRVSSTGSSTISVGDPDRSTGILASIAWKQPVKNGRTRFFPSEFGNDVDRTNALEPAKTAFGIKVQIRRAIEAENIPYTYVSSNFFAGYFLPSLAQATTRSLPTDKVVILGDGNAKAIFNDEDDIGAYTIKAVDDPRTLNKVLYLRPPANIYSHNELVSLWEKKTGKKFERVYISEEDFVKQIKEAPFPVNVILSIHHTVFLKGDHTNFEIEPSFGVEGSQLYPDIKYTTVEEYLNRFL